MSAIFAAVALILAMNVGVTAFLLFDYNSPSERAARGSERGLS